MIRFVLVDGVGHYYSGDYPGKYDITVQGTTDDLCAAVIFNAEVEEGKLVVKPDLPVGGWTARHVRVEVRDG